VETKDLGGAGEGEATVEVRIGRSSVFAVACNPNMAVILSGEPALRAEPPDLRLPLGLPLLLFCGSSVLRFFCSAVLLFCPSALLPFCPSALLLFCGSAVLLFDILHSSLPLPVILRLVGAGNSKMCALGAAMRKLAHIVFGVLKHRKPYQPMLTPT
jgi:hypothetical protein